MLPDSLSDELRGGLSVQSGVGQDWVGTGEIEGNSLPLGSFTPRKAQPRVSSLGWG